MYVSTSSSIVSSKVALQLLANKNSGPGEPTQNGTGIAPASRYVSGESSAKSELQGFYADPRLKPTSQTGAKLAGRLIEALETTLNSDVKEYKNRAQAQLEAAIGRSLDEGESFMDLGTYVHSNLPQDVLDANRSVETINISFSSMMSRAKTIDLETTLVAGQPDELVGLDMSKKQDRQIVVEYAIRLQTSINTAGIKWASEDAVASKMLDKSLKAAGVEQKERLQANYSDFHRERFENGEFSVKFGGIEITSDSL